MHLKSLIAVAFGTVLITSAGQALADRDDRRGYRGDHHSDNGWHRFGTHDSPHRYSGRHYRNRHHLDWRHSRGNNVRIYHNYRHRSDLADVIGGALIGSAITHSLHGTYENRRYYRNPGQITGCYRVEQLGRGRERRVELPLSRCR